ncbi:TetR/AcrR family transcriptional regulator [Rhizobium sp. RCAM05350]|nr:TetR/AcrR family transcriptional regulator [Rhizobium sp. RCAM05350]
MLAEKTAYSSHDDQLACILVHHLPLLCHSDIFDLFCQFDIFSPKCQFNRMDEKKQHIMTAAAEVFTRYGFKKASMQDIADAAMMSAQRFTCISETRMICSGR